MKNYERYAPYKTMNMPNRKWPNCEIEEAPLWCSVDLRDGNQSLEIPMTLEQKLEFFQYLVKIGFKEIEIGFPAASDTEFQFARTLIEQNLIPDDVTVQVLTQSREAIIAKTFEALRGAKKAIVHLYNSTSTLQRDVVFQYTQEQTTALAVKGAKLLLEEEKKIPETQFFFEYSPESFTGTEVEYAVEICNAVIDVLQPTADKKLIINLPATVEMATPNVYADQIEYCSENLHHRENVILSLHAHNDRGTAVAATELGLMAGGDRVEGTLFGNGERTGNTDIMTVAMNLFSQGVDPKLDFSQIDEAIEIYERNTRLTVHPRHPYAGELVYTAFSGSHQDAIRKGMDKMKEHMNHWEVPYLPIDPLDVGRSYEPIVRINSQSGKGGVAFILEQNYGLFMSKNFQQNVGTFITKVSDSQQSDLSPEKIYDIFEKEYVNLTSKIELLSYKEYNEGSDNTSITCEIMHHGEKVEIKGAGNGIIASFCNALEMHLGIDFQLKDYREHALEQGRKAKAISYIEILCDDVMCFGAGISSNITKSSLRGIVSAINKISV